MLTSQPSLATSKRDLLAEVHRLSDLCDWHLKVGNMHLRWTDEDDERIELLKAENRILWERITELEAK
jgi:hypothetical protein